MGFFENIKMVNDMFRYRRILISRAKRIRKIKEQKLLGLSAPKSIPTYKCSTISPKTTPKYTYDFLITNRIGIPKTTETIQKLEGKGFDINLSSLMGRQILIEVKYLDINGVLFREIQVISDIIGDVVLSTYIEYLANRIWNRLNQRTNSNEKDIYIGGHKELKTSNHLWW